MIKKLFYYIQLFIMGVYRIVRDYVIPTINFLQFLKDLLSEEIEKIDAQTRFNKKSLAESLGLAESIIDKLVNSFVYAIKQILPELAPTGTTYFNVIKNFVVHLKDKDTSYISMLLFKMASLMLVHWNKSDKKPEIKEYEADLLVQIVYSNEKFKTV
jgi:hypothetical protein